MATKRGGTAFAATLELKDRAPAQAPLYERIVVEATKDGQTTAEVGYTYAPPQRETFAYDDDGNLLRDGRWDYTWDAENRLVSQRTRADAVAAGLPDRILTFAYDGAGRRIAKTATEAGVVRETRFLYDGWKLLAELEGLTGVATATYLWGLDLSGSGQGSSAEDSGGCWWLGCREGNGEVGPDEVGVGAEAGKLGVEGGPIGLG